MTDEELLRYSRHILLDEIGIEGQQRIGTSHALIVGAGGLGSPAALYLGAAGVGHISIVDPDQVELTNLQRQLAHTMAWLGQPKAQSAAAAIAAINPQVKVTAMVARAEGALLAALVAQADVVLDCCDNFVTRQAINRACVENKKPLVSGAAIRFDGQVGVYDPRLANSPCYACVFPPRSNVTETACASLGVFAPLVGIIGSVQAAEALKLITGAGRSLTGRLLLLDARSMEFSEIRLPRNPQCEVCGSTRAQQPPSAP